MEFHGVRLLNIDLLGLSQIYLSSDKVASVMEWFDPQRMDNFQPLLVHDFGNNIYTLTDGHTRTYVAYKNGVSVLPVVYDNDDIITNQIGQMLYKADIDWCKRFKISHIKHLESRILDKSAYQKLWHERCDRSYNLLTKTSYNERIQLQCLAPDLFLYGASENMLVLFFENETGELFLYKDNTLTKEKQTTVETEIR
ncbi:hypothetical protein [Fumia xinanensis]|uniref:Uncharacterized protein n=1 Tax=Fumia xinanensis TaxID=2763659 RepID=A0A926E3P9_9FIRM|nr:hypothetical protein [Fumia xinanensis]MBC8559554.1 hypothetical protein [Fumia xinanensis]